MASHIHWEKNIGRRFQLRDLQVFFAVAERGSMAKAASELGVTQPSVSAAIAGLETSLGVRLFDRSPKGVALTAAGGALLARGRAAFDELRQGVRDIEHLSKPDVGEVRIGCPESIAAGFLPAVIDRLSHEYPDVSLTVAHVVTPTLEYRELDERKLDVVLALLAVPDPKNVPQNYVAELLFEERLCIVTGRKSPLLRRRQLDFDELSRKPWVTGPADSPGTRWIAELFRSAGVNFPTRCITTWSVHLRYNMAATGRFISTMPKSAFDYAADRYGLGMISIKLTAPRWPFAAVTLRNRNLSPVVDLFLKCARDVAKSQTTSRARLDGRR
jgi:DNA-binding transcriptional LysR family regulator